MFIPATVRIEAQLSPFLRRKPLRYGARSSGCGTTHRRFTHPIKMLLSHRELRKAVLLREAAFSLTPTSTTSRTKIFRFPSVRVTPLQAGTQRLTAASWLQTNQSLRTMTERSMHTGRSIPTQSPTTTPRTAASLLQRTQTFLYITPQLTSPRQPQRTAGASSVGTQTRTLQQASQA